MNKFESTNRFKFEAIIQFHFTKHQVRKFSLYIEVLTYVAKFATSRYITSSLLFLSKFAGRAFPNRSGCFLCLLEVLVATEGCSPSITEVYSVQLCDATSMSSLLLSDCESVDSVLMSSGSSRAIWLFTNKHCLV